MGKQWKQWQTLFSWAAKSLWMVTTAMKFKKTLASWKKNYDKPKQHIKKQRHYFANKGYLVKAIVFPVVMSGCESWTIKKVNYQRIDAFELLYWRRLLRVPWTARIKPVNPKGNQSWIFIRRSDAEAETPMHWPPAAKSWLNGNDPDDGKDWGWEEKGRTEDEMVGWHHRLNGHGFE